MSFAVSLRLENDFDVIIRYLSRKLTLQWQLLLANAMDLEEYEFLGRSGLQRQKEIGINDKRTEAALTLSFAGDESSDHSQRLPDIPVTS